MENYLEVLKSVKLFQGIDEKDLEKVVKCLGGRTKKFLKDEEIFSVGDKISDIGIILSGEIQILKEDYLGNRNILTSLKAGEIFAEAFVSSGLTKIPVTVLGKTKGEVLYINYQQILNPCSATCNFCNILTKNMLQLLARKNIILTEKIDILSKRTTREKILAYLESVSMTLQDKKGEDLKLFFIDYNRQELADYLNVDRSALSREISKLSKEDGIEIFGRTGQFVEKK